MQYPKYFVYLWFCYKEEKLSSCSNLPASSSQQLCISVDGRKLTKLFMTVITTKIFLLFKPYLSIQWKVSFGRGILVIHSKLKVIHVYILLFQILNLFLSNWISSEEMNKGHRPFEGHQNLFFFFLSEPITWRLVNTQYSAVWICVVLPVTCHESTHFREQLLGWQRVNTSTWSLITIICVRYGHLHEQLWLSYVLLIPRLTFQVLYDEWNLDCLLIGSWKVV